MPNEITFAGSIPEMYDRGMGPVVFEPYAEEIAARVPVKPGMRVLEIAAGTGRVTRHLLRRLPDDGELVATDLSLDMLTVARRQISDLRVEWEVADALCLPFLDGAFDVVVCQFGVMFFPDKLQGYREAHRVLAPGGTYLLSVWDHLARNPWAKVAHQAFAECFPGDPEPLFVKPFSYHDGGEIGAALGEAGFAEIQAEWVTFELVAESAGAFAGGLVAGTPISTAILERGGDIDTCVHAVAAAFRQEFGDHPMQSPMSALVVTAKKS